MKTIYILTLIITGCAFFPVFYTRNTNEYLCSFAFFLSVLPFMWLVSHVSEKILKPFDSIGKASEAELKREDDVFLQGVAFSQSTLFIVMNMLDLHPPLIYVKWLVPIVSIIFFVTRSFGKIKGNSSCRYYSTHFLIAILWLNIALLVYWFCPVLSITGINVAGFYWFMILLIGFFTIVDKAERGLRRRYGCK